MSTAAAGTISQIERGFASFPTKSTRDEAPTACSCASRATVSFDMSKTTHVCPPPISRRTMFAPIRPSPIIPSCMARSLPGQPAFSFRNASTAAAASASRAAPRPVTSTARAPAAARAAAKSA